MVGRCLLTCTFLFLIKKVSLEETIHAVEGDTIILPCLYSGDTVKDEDMDVNWRYNDTLTVYNIYKGKGSVEKQDPAYRGRTESFPLEYAKGKFSIKLSSVRPSDHGMYKCFLLFGEDISVKLQVKPAPQPTSRPKNKAMGSRSVLSSLIFIVLLVYNLL